MLHVQALERIFEKELERLRSNFRGQSAPEVTRGEGKRILASQRLNSRANGGRRYRSVGADDQAS